MTVARSGSDVLSEHAVFEVGCIDRMYLNVYVPGLQCAAGLVAYVHQQLGLPIASTPPLAKITDAFSAAVHRFVRTGGVPWVDFAKGQRKDDVMHEHLERFTGSEGGAVRRASAGEDEVVSLPSGAATAAAIPTRESWRAPGW